MILGGILSPLENVLTEVLIWLHETGGLSWAWSIVALTVIVRVLLVPGIALSNLGQMERVFVVGENNRAVLRLVKTGATRGERLEILSGLDAGERVVVAPPAGLREGQTLEILP